jgi:sugar lactone lactonase YvrE
VLLLRRTEQSFLTVRRHRWFSAKDSPEGAIVRIWEGGEVLERIEDDRTIFVAMLWGSDRTTLFLLAAEWRGIEHVDEATAPRTGQVLITRAPTPGAGWP